MSNAGLSRYGRIMTKIIVAYLATLIAFAAIDSLWLINMAPRLYKPEIGPVMMEEGFRLVPAMIFYAIYIGGILHFAVLPGLAAGNDGGVARAALQGAVLGFLCYATYDFTNYATLKVWSLKVTVLDLIWGTVLTGGTAAAGTFITGWVMNRFFPA
jgi:uncharacterized membrane protein